MEVSQNPLGIKGIHHLELTVDSLESPTGSLLGNLGFLRSGKGEGIELFTQGQIRFLINARSSGHHRNYFNKHGEGISKISFLVENAEKALETAVQRGARPHEDVATVELEHGPYSRASIEGVGDILNEFVQHPPGASPPLPEIGPSIMHDRISHPLRARLSRIDHLTNNVPKGEMEHWVDFYKKIYGFVETRYFDIKGEKTGLQSKVVQLANNSVIIPINEPDEKRGKSQIQEFLDEHKGPGVQHIAFMSSDILSTISELRERKLSFLDVPDTYYEDLVRRPFSLTEDIEDLRRRRLLADGDSKGYLLQIFTEALIGPLFFEFIQRKNHWGFGEGNFQALFDAIERDQIKRGYLEK